MKAIKENKVRVRLGICVSALIILLFAGIIVMQAKLVGMIVQEKDGQLYDLAYSVDNNLYHELHEIQTDMETVAYNPLFVRREMDYLESGEIQGIKEALPYGNLNYAHNVAGVLMVDGQSYVSVMGDLEGLQFTFIDDHDHDDIQVCFDDTGAYYLSIEINNPVSRVLYYVIVDLGNFYDNLIPPSLREETWIVICHEESGLMIQNHDNQLPYHVFTDEELETRGDGFSFIMQQQKQRQRGAMTYKYENYHGRLVDERIVALPDNETINGSFAIGIAQDCDDFYHAMRSFNLWILICVLSMILCSGFVLYLIYSFNNEKKTALAKAEAERSEHILTEKLLEAQLQNSISQMQPHFIYNALSSIRELIYDEPEAAASLLYDFTRYLRSCIKSLRSREMIPFSEEIENIRAYTNIEKMRFGDKLRIACDIHETEFEVVPLSIQPFVENAIRHGIANNRGMVGTVEIISAIEGDDYVITIRDDGAGFDVYTVMKDIRAGKRDSTGLSNSILRLEKKMGARIDIQSKVGEGTTVVIRISREVL